MRRKTKKIAHTAIPEFVWAMLHELKPESEYFFWSGNRNPDSRVDTFRDPRKKLFVAAELRHPRKLLEESQVGN